MSKANYIRYWKVLTAAAALCASISAGAWTGTGVIQEVHESEVVIGDGALAFSPDLRVNLASGVGSIGAQQLKPGLPVRFEVDEDNPRLVKEIWILKSAPKISNKYGDER
ncbi:MAG: hypothetical protein KJO38_11150 [Gammaproteobacteria bacterium]|nr:hypothetical protein [Gammaproteobacteria bacterium]